MKYWRGFLVAAIFAAITWALTEFAKAHSVLVDMIYPYMARLISMTLTQWSSGMSACLWQVLLVILVLIGIGTLVLVIRYLNDWDVTIHLVAADVTGDAQLTLEDAVCLQRYLNGWNVELN